MKILSFGEVLWDVFNEQKLIGGAPFNFCGHLAKLGADAYIITAVGNDKFGDKAISEIERIHVKTDFVFRNPLPTGRCIVSIENGLPSYQLLENVAYDAITLPEEKLSDIQHGDFDALYFGTLAQRSGISSHALNQIVGYGYFHEIFCDINIRQQYYNRDTLQYCLDHATILKVSREEISAIRETGFSPSTPASLNIVEDYTVLSRWLCHTFGIRIVIITMDKDGAFLYESKQDKFYVSKSPKNEAISTVGAGDSFSACFLYNYLSNQSLETCLSRAVDLSDFVVTKTEAIPDYPPDMIQQIYKPNLRNIRGTTDYAGL